eukprot:EG_transcript_12152
MADASSSRIATDLRGTLVLSILNARLPPGQDGPQPPLSAAQDFHLRLEVEDAVNAKVQGVLANAPETVFLSIVAPAAPTPNEKFITLELWVLHFDAQARAEPHKGATLKKAVLLVRAVHAFLRLMPAHRIVRRGRHTRLASHMSCRVADQRPASPVFPGPTTHHGFAALPTPVGRLTVAVQYADAVPEHLLATNVPRLHIIPDYATRPLRPSLPEISSSTSSTSTAPFFPEHPGHPTVSSTPPFSCRTPPSHSSSLASLTGGSPPLPFTFFAACRPTPASIPPMPAPGEDPMHFFPAVPSLSSFPSFGSLPRSPSSGPPGLPRATAAPAGLLPPAASNPATPLLRPAEPPPTPDFSLFHAFGAAEDDPKDPQDDLTDFADLCLRVPALTLTAPPASPSHAAATHFLRLRAEFDALVAQRRARAAAAPDPPPGTAWHSADPR